MEMLDFLGRLIDVTMDILVLLIDVNMDKPRLQDVGICDISVRK